MEATDISKNHQGQGDRRVLVCPGGSGAKSPAFEETPQCHLLGPVLVLNVQPLGSWETGTVTQPLTCKGLFFPHVACPSCFHHTCHIPLSPALLQGAFTCDSGRWTPLSGTGLVPRQRKRQRTTDCLLKVLPGSDHLCSPFIGWIGSHDHDASMEQDGVQPFLQEGAPLGRGRVFGSPWR